MKEKVVKNLRDAVSGSTAPDVAARGMSDEDHKEIQVYCAILEMRIERRMARMELCLMLLSVAVLFSVIAQLLLQ